MADREENVDINRTPGGITVKVTLREQRVKVSYTIKPMGSRIDLAVQEARKAAEGYLAQALRGANS